MNLAAFSGAAKAAAIFAILALIVSVSSMQTTARNGVRTCSFIDYGALIFGVLAVLVGILAMVSKPAHGDRLKGQLIGFAAVIVGVWRAGYGAGLIGGPC